MALRKWFLASFVLIPACVFAEAERSDVFLRWDQAEAIERIERSKHKADFFRLANNFEGQPNGVVCGPTTGAIVLNALRLGRAKAKLPKTGFDTKNRKFMPEKWDPRLERYTPENFIDDTTSKVKTWAQIYGQPINGKADFGFQLRQLH